MGTRVTTRTEELTAAIYDIDWYLMDPRQQKKFQLILVMTQNMKGIFSPVDLETFQQVANYISVRKFNKSLIQQILKFSFSLVAVVRSIT